MYTATYIVGDNGLTLIQCVSTDPLYLDPTRLALWTAAIDGDTVAKAALLDWYKDNGVSEYIPNTNQE